jgi:putative endonuclease
MIPQIPLSPAPHLAVGKDGETVACKFLQDLGYVIMGRNVRVGSHDEIDIIAYDQTDEVIVFVEVKSRSKFSDYQPVMNATRTKRLSMMRAALLWIANCQWDGGYRMDLVSVANGKVTEHIIELPWRNR